MEGLRRAMGVAALAAAVGCGGGGPEAPGGGGPARVRGVTADEVVLGMHTDLSGPTAIWGVGSTNGVRMRFDEANEAGGVHGRSIRLVVEDTQYQVPNAVRAANKLIHGDQVFAIVLGLGTPMNNTVLQEQLKEGVPNLFPLTGARSMVEPLHELKFTQRGIYYDEVRAAVRYFVESRGRQNVCVVYQDTDYGLEIVEGTEDQLAAMGKTLVERAAHKPTEKAFTAAVLRLKNAGCDLVVMGTVHADTILILDTARKIGWEGVDWVGNNATYAQAVANHESGEGYYAFVHMSRLYEEDPKSPEVQAWWESYKARFGQEPGLSAMEGYRGGDLVIEALERAGRDLTREKLITAIESIDDYEDIFGYDVAFGPTKHSGVTKSALSQIQNGRWVQLEESISY